jgi:hypothetical protein
MELLRSVLIFVISKFPQIIKKLVTDHRAGRRLRGVRLRPRLDPNPKDGETALVRSLAARAMALG